ncbi:response regulator [Variovorax soli]|uniref:PleD family two-component response regulator n=1 Tax=Variovorax soli TaxID=376815 RepID=A0ABU1NPG5_9BURK|nr:response regulator [Variovorax soli]MDR6539746.1 PleD family two-component response regulator [Variovorax soli]
MPSEANAAHLFSSWSASVMKRGSMLGTRNRSVAEEDTAFDRVAVMPQTLRILMVEDLPATLMMTVELLGELGHWAAGVTSAELALLRYPEGAFDVLMVDVGLPGLSGVTWQKNWKHVAACR